MASSTVALSSSRTQVPLFLPPELRESVLYSAAEIVVESGARRRCFLHIHSEEERISALQAGSAIREAVRRAHEHWLEELRWARNTLYEDPRIRRFVRHPHHLVWPAYTHVSSVAAVVHQLLLCDEESGAAAVKRAGDITRAAQIVAKEATQPGLHVLTESQLPGQALLYHVAQTRKRERGANALSMPFVLTRVEETMEGVGWVAEARQVSYTVADLLELPFAVAPLRRLVELLQPPATTASSPFPPAAVRQQWKKLLDHHRALAKHQSLFADVAESCRGWGASEACVADEVSAAVAAQHSVYLRTGVHMTVVHRRQMVLLLSTHPRRIENLKAVEQQAVLSALTSSHTWTQCLSEGLVRVVVVQRTAGSFATASLEATIRHHFLSPALTPVSLVDCCVVSTPRALHADLHLVTLSAVFNPYVVVHGCRVDGGFEGDLAYLQTLQRERDRVVAERTDEQLRRGYTEPAAPRAATSSAAAAASARLKRAPTSTASTDAGAYHFTRTLVSLLNVAPLSKAEIQQHPSMQEFRSEGNFEAQLNARLKELAEYKGRRYQLRD